MWHLGTLTSSGLLNLTWWSWFLFNIQCRRRRPVVAFYVFCASFQHIFYAPFIFPFSVFHSISFPFSMFFVSVFSLHFSFIFFFTFSSFLVLCQSSETLVLVLSHSIFPLVIFIIIANASRVMFLIDKMFLVLNSTFLSWHFWFSVMDISWFLQFNSRCSSVSDFWHTGHRSDPLLLIFFSHAFERTWPNLSLDIWTSCFLGKSKYFMFVET